MTLWTLILRNLRHHARAHAGVLLGAAVGSAVLIGALLVGDSVRASLREMALQRLGKIEAAMATGDRLFTTALATNLNAAPVLALTGTANSADGSRRANRVHVLGVDRSFWMLAAKAPVFADIPSDSVVLNQPLAGQLAAKVGDEVLLRVSKVSALSQDVALNTRDGQTVALRLRVHAVIGKEEFGRFSLQANQVAPFNAFLSKASLGSKVNAEEQANMAVKALVHSPKVDRWDSKLRMKNENTHLRFWWRLADAKLDLSLRTNSPAFELRTDRIFLDPPVVRAAQSVDTNAQPSLTYLATLLRAGDRATAYPMVTAASAPLVPADLRDDEVVVNQWLADQLQLAPGTELDLSYFLPDSGARLVEATNRFRVRSIVPMQMPWADRTLMPDFPGIADAERVGDWDAGFPLTHSKLVDDSYWNQWRGTPKAFVNLSAGRKMWANRFGDTTAIRFPVAADVRRLTSISTNGAPSPGTQSEPPHVGSYQKELENALLTHLNPADFGLVFQPVREQALAASAQSQDFGGLFIGFSFFLIVAALVLMALLFQFGVEQRATEVGTLLALGFTPARVRRLLLLEGAALALLGGLLGMVGGIAYARAMLHGLTTIWRDAVGTSSLHYHASPVTLVIGAAAAVLVALGTIWFALRKQVAQPARVLLSGGGEEVFSVQCSVFSVQAAGESAVQNLRGALPHPGPLPPEEGTATNAPGEPSVVGSVPALGAALTNAEPVTRTPLTRPPGTLSPRPTRGEGWGEGWSAQSRQGRRISTLWLAVSCLLAALALVGWAVAKEDTAAAGLFFGAGALLLVASLAFTAALLSRLEGSEAAAQLSLAGMGVRNATRRRRRSLATVAMLACGSFLIVSIGAFRLDENANATKRSAGTGGFAFLGESTLPVVQDLNTKAGREFFTLDEKELAGVDVVPFRVRDGDDASCLNLNRAQKPRLLGVQPELLVQRGAFAFAGVAKGIEKSAGWNALRSRRGNEADNSQRETPNAKPAGPPPHVGGYEIPGIADEASILWALGKKLGDTIDFTDERGQPFKVRLVASLANSILQGSIVIDHDEFVARFPNEAGYRMFLVDAPTNRAAEVSATLTRALRDVGLELTPATRRLAQLNAVQNTYLSTFQVLGGLGLLLGSVGLGVVVLRNVLERRGELALLLAVGFRPASLRALVLSEHGALLLLGLGGGVAAALVAVLPALRSPGAEFPVASLALTLGAVLASGALWTWAATRLALRGRLLDALRSE